MITRHLILLLLFIPLFSEAQIDLQLELLSNGFSQPVDLTNAGDERLFVVEKGGRIRILHQDGTINPTPFLDIDTIVRSTESERGLLGLAFHPNYAENGYFFVNCMCLMWISWTICHNRNFPLIS